MLIVKKVQKNLDGSYETTWQLSEEQMGFFLTFAINSLVAEGLVEVDEQETDKQLELFNALPEEATKQ
jgi:hypothetical protein